MKLLLLLNTLNSVCKQHDTRISFISMIIDRHEIKQEKKRDGGNCPLQDSQSFRGRFLEKKTGKIIPVLHICGVRKLRIGNHICLQYPRERPSWQVLQGVCPHTGMLRVVHNPNTSKYFVHGIMYSGVNTIPEAKQKHTKCWDTADACMHGVVSPRDVVQESTARSDLSSCVCLISALCSPLSHRRITFVSNTSICRENGKMPLFSLFCSGSLSWQPSNTRGAVLYFEISCCCAGTLYKLYTRKQRPRSHLLEVRLPRKCCQCPTNQWVCKVGVHHGCTDRIDTRPSSYADLTRSCPVDQSQLVVRRAPTTARVVATASSILDVIFLQVHQISHIKLKKKKINSSGRIEFAQIKDFVGNAFFFSSIFRRNISRHKLVWYTTRNGNFLFATKPSLVGNWSKRGSP